MAFTINPDSVTLAPTKDPLVFVMSCDVTKDTGKRFAVTTRINQNMRKTELMDAIRLGLTAKSQPVEDAATYRATLISTTLADVMVRPVSVAAVEPIAEAAFKEV